MNSFALKAVPRYVLSPCLQNQSINCNVELRSFHMLFFMLQVSWGALEEKSAWCILSTLGETLDLAETHVWPIWSFFLFPSRSTTAIRSRMQSTVAANLRQNSTFSANWLGDLSTYPILAIMGAAATGCSAFMLYKFSSCPDVRVKSTTKGKVVRDW